MDAIKIYVLFLLPSYKCRLRKKSYDFQETLIVVRITANYTTCNFTSFLYGGVMGAKQFCMKVADMNIVEDFSTMNGTSCNQKERKKAGVRYIQKLRLWNGIKSCKSEADVCWICNRGQGEEC